jgi:hypothetical protein
MGRVNLLKIGLILATVLWSSTGCYSFEPERYPPIAVSELTQNRHLLYATQTSAATFFERVLNVRPRKASGVGNWRILHRDDAFLYYGYPVFRGLLTSEKEIPVLYKVSLYEVQKQFPDFLQWQAQHPPAAFKQRIAELFKRPVEGLDWGSYHFDPERSDYFAFESNLRFKDLSVPCRYRFEMLLPSLMLKQVEALPIQQKISAVCPEVSSLSL